jgi:hypothetical protein
MPKEREALCVRLRGGGDADIHPFGFVDFVVVDFRENQLVSQA